MRRKWVRVIVLYLPNNAMARGGYTVFAAIQPKYSSGVCCQFYYPATCGPKGRSGSGIAFKYGGGHL